MSERLPEGKNVGCSALLGVVRRSSRRNSHGVKDASNCWRTINGAEYQAWLSFPSTERIARYRAAAVRCRRYGVELFVHIADLEAARSIDEEIDAPIAQDQGPEIIL